MQRLDPVDVDVDDVEDAPVVEGARAPERRSCVRSSGCGCMSKSSNFEVSKIRVVVGRWSAHAPAHERWKAGSARPVDVEGGNNVEVDGGQLGWA